MAPRSLITLAAWIALAAPACSSDVSLGTDGVRDASVGVTPAGPCPSEPMAGAVCAKGLVTCIYWAERTTCGTTYCPCRGGLPAGNACAMTGGCRVPTDNLEECRTGGTCNAGTGCVVMSCGRSCVCGSDGTWQCAADSCDATPLDAGVDEGVDRGVESETDAPPKCVPGKTACTNCVDDDGDGLIDALDPECTAPWDNDESSFAIGLVDEFYEPCKRDCGFDPNSGTGDDGCITSLQCIPGTTEPRCLYDAAAAGDPTRCPAPSDKCQSVCRPIIPKGCDCYGCCEVFDSTGASRTVLLPNSGCSLKTIADPTRCMPCTIDTRCRRPCERCDTCIGRTTVPSDCDAAAVCGTAKVCGRDRPPCATGEFCLSGCCTPIPSLWTF